ncbi:kinase-like domain-containing protein [Mucor mucedo]|uniref:kinase-like domain-containing protein n=1 Tax=Mucor mucedo TaxID=29922 RepID=UPI00221FA843|nr:kinase-like domain-containing protein [Mucor mucedo]KAI7865645.1 kinase-like domain-containing protein [Mucor mucedo]
MTPSVEEDSSSSLDNTSYFEMDKQSGKLVVGPEGNTILCDSPAPSELPPYSSPDEASTSKEILRKRHSVNASRRSISTERTKPRRVIGNFTLVNTLGSGSMGKVRLAVHNITGDKLAVKIVPRRQPRDGKSSRKKEKDEHREVRTIREASIMLLLHHPYIVSLKELVILDSYYYLFMEYVNGGQLLDYIISHGKLKEKQARRFARQIVSALDYCHRNSIVHRDLKIENILISQSGNIKIIDFGLSNLFSPRSSLNTFCGSLYFAAPELLNAKAYTGPEIDVWSFGVVLYVLVCGKVPFDDQNMPALHEKIKRGVVDYPSHLSTDCKSVLSRMLVTNPAHRATVSEVIIHPWMNKGYDAPVNNYLPDRPPLTLPIDMDVVRGMTGFEFGTEAEIKDKLEKIITSIEYQKAAKILADRTAETHRNHRQGHTSRFSPHTSKKAFVLPNEDPQSIPAAYHPLVSIYYLVRERLDRENEQNSPLSPDTAISSSLRIPDITLPENAHASTNIPYESVFGDESVSSGVAYGKKGKATIHVDEDGHMLETPNTDTLHAIENGINRLFTRTRSNQSSENTDEGSPGGRDSNNVLRRLSLALSRTSTDKGSRSRKSSATHGETTVLSSTSTPIQIPSRENDGKYLSKSYVSPKFPNSKYNSQYHHTSDQSQSLQQSDLDVATAAAAAASVSSANTSNSNTFGNKISKILPRRMTLGQSNINAENHNNFLNMVHGHHHHEARGTSKKSPTKNPSLVVDCEKKKVHDHEQSFPATAGGSFQQKGTADENIKPVFLKGLFSVTTTSTKHPSVIRADLIRVLERIGVKWRESKGRFECVHMPSIDLNVVVNDELEDQHSFSSEEATTAATNTPVVPVPDLVVRFEIYIVKVPWLLGMHGLQFRRVGGDPWQYKNMCSKILTELKL